MVKEKTDKKISILLKDVDYLESYVSDLFNFFPLPICFVSILNIILEINPAFEKITKYNFDEIVGESLTKILKEEDVKNINRQIIEEDLIKGKEIEMILKNKESLFVQLFAKARKDEQNKVVGFFIGLFDLTQIKQTKKEVEQKIMELERFNKLVINREIEMVRLKEEIKILKNQLNK